MDTFGPTFPTYILQLNCGRLTDFKSYLIIMKEVEGEQEAEVVPKIKKCE
jgi:hypothetical protein